MTNLFQPPPTAILPVLGEGETAVYNPVWVRWFLDLINSLNTAVSGGGSSAEVSTQVFGGRDTSMLSTLLYQNDTQALIAAQAFIRKVSPAQTLGQINTIDAILAGQIFGG